MLTCGSTCVVQAFALMRSRDTIDLIAVDMFVLNKLEVIQLYSKCSNNWFIFQTLFFEKRVVNVSLERYQDEIEEILNHIQLLLQCHHIV